MLLAAQLSSSRQFLCPLQKLPDVSPCKVHPLPVLVLACGLSQYRSSPTSSPTDPSCYAQPVALILQAFPGWLPSDSQSASRKFTCLSHPPKRRISRTRLRGLLPTPFNPQGSPAGTQKTPHPQPTLLSATLPGVFSPYLTLTKTADFYLFN